MTAPLINILTRTTKGREKEYRNCMERIGKQTYRNFRVVVCYDDKSCEDYVINSEIVLWNQKATHFFVKPTGQPFHWNFYCNNLKERVTDGWFLYCDDDDYLVNPQCLANLATHLTNPNEGVICQFNRGIHPKPIYDFCEVFNRDNGHSYVKQSSIVKGKIGGSCIVLHHSQKDIAHWDGAKAADYRFIKAVSEQIPLKWVPVVVVQAGNKGRRGK